MKRVYITGMSGTGKTSVIEALRSLGFTAIDTDYDNWCELSTLNGEPEWLLRESKMYALLTTPSNAPLFMAGCCSNQSKFYNYFDYRVLLSAPLEVMIDRVDKRTSNLYGKSETERNEICCNFEQFQPLLKKSADLEIDTTLMSVSEISELLIKLAYNGLSS